MKIINFFRKKYNKDRKYQYSPVDEFEPYLHQLPDSNIKTYITERVMGQIKWYDSKSNENQHRYKQMMVASVILSAIIPVLTIIVDYGSAVIKIFITALSSSVTAISAILTLYNYKDLWVQYRSNCEILKSVLHRFFNKCGEFSDLSDEQMYQNLINSCEDYMTKEFRTWVAHSSQVSESKDS